MVINGKANVNKYKGNSSLKEMDAKQSNIQENFGKTWQLEKSKGTFTLGFKEVVRFLYDDEQMKMIRDYNGDDTVSVSTYSQIECQLNPRQN